jgi:hypothetical protein
MLAGLLTGCLRVSGSSCDRPSGLIFYLVFSCFQANTEMGLKILQVVAATWYCSCPCVGLNLLELNPLPLRGQYIYVYISKSRILALTAKLNSSTLVSN